MVVNCNLSFVFKALRRGAIGFFHVVLYFSIRVNGKLNIKVQSVTKVIVQGTKRTFEKFRVQNTIWDIVYGDNM